MHGNVGHGVLGGHHHDATANQDDGLTIARTSAAVNLLLTMQAAKVDPRAVLLPPSLSARPLICRHKAGFGVAAGVLDPR